MSPLKLASLLGISSLLLPSCRSIKGDSSPNAIEAVAVKNKNHGGPFNFGVNFSPVDEAIAKKFWSSWQDEKSFTKIALKNLPLGESEAYSESGAAFEFEVSGKTHVKDKIAQIVRTWFDGTSGRWAKLQCQNIDMDAALEGKFQASEGINWNRDEPNCNYTSFNGKFLNNGGTYVKIPGWQAEISWKVSPDLRPGTMRTPDTLRKFSIGVIDDAPGVAPGFIVNVTPDLEKSGLKALGQSVTFIVVGNFLVPTHGWATSKTFATPVLEFDPLTLAPKAWYDFGLLTLNALPAQGNLLISRVDKAQAALWSDPQQRKSVGYLSKVFPSNRLNTFLKAADALNKNYISDTNMERVPIGSVHFIANAWWPQMGRGLTHFAYLKDLSRKDLIDLYLTHSKESGGLWVNSLDRLDFSKDGPKLDSIRQSLVEGSCAHFPENTGMAPEMFMETEIILGMTKGRALILGDRAGVSKCVLEDAVE